MREVDAVEVGPNGVAENRRLHLVDAAGRLVNGKTSMRLTLVGSRLDSEAGTLALDFPEQGVVAGALELGEPFETVFFGRPASGRLVAGPWNAALSAWAGIDVRLVMSDEVGAASDRGPGAGVSIISAASIADLARTGGARRSTPGASACSSRSMASSRTPKTPGSAAVYASAKRSYSLTGTSGAASSRPAIPRRA